jgi:hypothetical protein
MLVVDLSVRHEILGDLNAENLNAKSQRHGRERPLEPLI